MVIGLRLRFFFFLLVILIFTAFGMSFFLFYFSRIEKLELIDGQLREASLVLINSDFADLKRINFAEAEDMISDELGEKRVGKFFIVRNNQGDVVFESGGSDALPFEIPSSPTWITIERDKTFVRILNLQVPRRSDRTLQVGMLLDQGILSWLRFDWTFWRYVALLLAGIGVLSFFGSRMLVRPIQRLSDYVETASSQIGHAQEFKLQLPEVLSRMRHSRVPDFFAKLVEKIERLLAEVEKRHHLTKRWSFHLAHELKTPMTRIQQNLDAQDNAAAAVELRRMADLIHSFLNWAEVDNLLRPKFLHANRLAAEAQKARQRLGLTDSTDLRIETDRTVFASPLHLEQSLQNLLMNADKYRSPGSKILVRVNAKEISISNESESDLAPVLKRLGEPFNKGDGESRERHGLGIAYVISVCQIYGWSFSIHQNEARLVTARLQFE